MKIEEAFTFLVCRICSTSLQVLCQYHLDNSSRTYLVKTMVNYMKFRTMMSQGIHNSEFMFKAKHLYFAMKIVYKCGEG